MPATYPLDSQFDETFASQMAQLEAYNKHYYRPNSYLHKWWARRCGSTFRLILKGLVTDPVLADYYQAEGLAGKIVLDPMMGGGTTLHEAIRLGANVIGADLDPIPVLQARATLSDVALPELTAVYQEFYQQLNQRLGLFFQTTDPLSGQAVPLRFVLYGARRFLDGRVVIVVDSLTLRIAKGEATIRLCPACHQLLEGEALHDCQPAPDQPILLEKGDRWGRGRRSPITDDLTIPYWRRYVPLVVVGQRPSDDTLFFKTPDVADLAMIGEADQWRQTLPFDRAEFMVPHGRKSRQLHSHGVDNYLDLFSSRQLLYLHHAIQLLPQFALLPRLNLALLVSTSLEFNALLCGYKGKNPRRPGAIRHTFSHHAYSFPHTAVENNPLHPGRGSGTLQRLFHTRIHNGRVWAQAPRERQLAPNTFVTVAGERDAGQEVDSSTALCPEKTHQFLLQQGSSAQLNLPDASVDFVVTDPPYYDSVQYSDLATFFRVWLRHLWPIADGWGYDMQLSAVDPHQLDRESRYTDILGQIFSECARVLKADGRLVFTFHHWNPKGWAALTIALQRAGFRLVNRYVVLSESPLNVHVAGMKALLHDVVLVLAVGDGGEWPRPLAVDASDSEPFCRDCGSLLGWLLAQNLEETAVGREWSQAVPS